MADGRGREGLGSTTSTAANADASVHAGGGDALAALIARLEAATGPERALCGIDPGALADDLYTLYKTRRPGEGLTEARAIIHLHQRLGELRAACGIKVFDEKLPLPGRRP